MTNEIIKEMKKYLNEVIKLAKTFESDYGKGVYDSYTQTLNFLNSICEVCK